MTYLSLNDIGRLVQKKIYEIQNRAGDKQLIWDNVSRKYVGHIENNGNFVQEHSYTKEDIKKAEQEKFDDYIGLNKGRDWGSSGW